MLFHRPAAQHQSGILPLYYRPLGLQLPNIIISIQNVLTEEERPTLGVLYNYWDVWVYFVARYIGCILVCRERVCDRVRVLRAPRHTATHFKDKYPRDDIKPFICTQLSDLSMSGASDFTDQILLPLFSINLLPASKTQNETIPGVLLPHGFSSCRVSVSDHYVNAIVKYFLVSLPVNTTTASWLHPGLSSSTKSWTTMHY